MFSFLRQVQELRQLLEEKKFSQYARKVQAFFGDVAAFLEKIEGTVQTVDGFPLNPPVGSVGDIVASADLDAALAFADQWKMDIATVGVGLEDNTVGMDPSTVISIVSAIISLLQMIRNRRQVK